MARGWGFWTRGKLDILRDYLDAFTTATKKADTRLYLDLFAGGPENIDRDSGEPFPGSAEIALSIDEPAFEVLRFFELRHGEELERYLRRKYPGRDVKVYNGDCNGNINAALDQLAYLDRAPAFAFLDPNGPHYRWSTLEALAGFKPRHLTKVELWMLFPVDMFVRFLPTDGVEVEPRHAQSISAMYGTDQWKAIYRARLRDRISPSQARVEYVNLMRWRLERFLGYAWTHALEVHNERGRSIYHLIFATDHEAGDRIMKHLYGIALREFPRMRQQAIDRRLGAIPLFESAEYIDENLRYEPEPPWVPFGHG